jgi:hypothetical protein
MWDRRTKINRQQMAMTAVQYRRLVANYRTRRGSSDTAPEVKYFDPCGPSTWLLTELDPETGIAFGLCDLGQGFPELGAVDLNELAAIGTIERDNWFTPQANIGRYADAARARGGLVGLSTKDMA